VSRCGEAHPDLPGVECERDPCIAYHRAGQEIWGEGASPQPAQRTDPERVLGIKQRTEARARRTDPVTSHQAAASVGDLTVAQQAILDVLKTGPRTDEEIYKEIPRRGARPIMSVSGARTRRSELVDMGLVEDSGAVGQTQHGRDTIIWRAVT
jgi:hypothetical protein